MKSNDLKDKIKNWLDEQGYPLEMRIASNLQRKGFNVIQSEYFVDPESGDSRELDVVASLETEISDITLRITLLIECKRSTDKPWLLFTSDKVQLAAPARISQRAANSLGKRFLTKICQKKEIMDIPLFQLPDRPAYGVTQAMTCGKDVCYSAATSVSKAALATVDQLNKEKDKYKNRFVVNVFDVCQIILPVIVVEGRLFEVHLQNDDAVTIDEVNCGTLLWRNPIVGPPHTIINIVSSEAIDQFSEECLKSIKTLFSLAKDKFSESLDKALEDDNRPPVSLL